MGPFMKALILILIYFIILFSQDLFSQDNPNEDSDTLVNIKPRVSFLVDSLLSSEKEFNKTVLSNLKGKSDNTVKEFSTSADSITNSVKDSISQPRLDSLKSLQFLLGRKIIMNTASYLLKLTEIPRNYLNKINSIKLLDFNDESDATDTLESIVEEFNEKLTTSVEDYYDELKDSLDQAVDSLGDYAQFLLDNQNDENDMLDSLRDYYYANGLFAKTGYTTDMQFRGYKGAGTQSAIFPGLYYNHPSGFGAFINVYNIEGTTLAWDELEIGASYMHEFNEHLTLSLSYTHYSFRDTSEISRQGLSGIASINLSNDFKLLTTSGSLDVSFGDQTDYALIIDLSKRIDLIKPATLQCWLEPGFTGTYGTETLLNNRIAKRLNAKKKIVKKTITTKSNVFSILDYQISIPINFEFGRLILTPEYDYSFPFNQPPSTGSASFGFFTINAAIKIL